MAPRTRLCADGESVIELMTTERLVVCATRRADGAGTLVAVDAATGELAWRAEVTGLDRLRAGTSRIAVASGATFTLFDANGAIERSGTTRDANVARFEFAGDRFILDEGGVLQSDGATPWRVRVDGYLVGLVSTEDSLLAHNYRRGGAVLHRR